MTVVVIELKPDLLATYLRRFLGEIRTEFFAHVDRRILDHFIDEAVLVVAKNWTKSTINLDSAEVDRGLDFLRSDPGWIGGEIIHCFHDAANIVRRELHAVHPHLVPDDLMERQWPVEMQESWCKRAVDGGVVSGVTRVCG